MTKGELIARLQGLDDEIEILSEYLTPIDIEYLPSADHEAVVLIKELNPSKQ